MRFDCSRKLLKGCKIRKSCLCNFCYIEDMETKINYKDDYVRLTTSVCDPKVDFDKLLFIMRLTE